MTQALSAEEKARLKKQWTELAVKLAQEGLWEEAVNTNKNVLNLFPQEPDALNRLGKAYSELGHYTEARQAYSQTLKYSPTNTIARRNLERLASMPETATRAPGGLDRIDPRIFIGETGKTGVSELRHSQRWCMWGSATRSISASMDIACRHITRRAMRSGRLSLAWPADSST